MEGGETGIKSKLLSFIPCTPRRQQANNVTGNRQQAGDAEMSDTSKCFLLLGELVDLVPPLIKSKLLSFIPCTPRRQQANNLTGMLKVHAEDAFKVGIKYTPPDPLVDTSGKDRVFQQHPDLYQTLATNVLAHYKHYKKDQIDKTYIPLYLYVGDPGTGKSRHASEFASSVQKAIMLRTQNRELAQRLEKAFVFHVSFENRTPLMDEEKSNLWNAIGVRMLHQLLGKPIDYIRSRYVATPEAVFRLVAAAEKVDLYDDFTGILVVDGIQKDRTGYSDGAIYEFLDQITAVSLMRRHPLDSKGGRAAPFIMTCVTTSRLRPTYEFPAQASHGKRVYLPLNRLDAPTCADLEEGQLASP